MNNFEYYNSCRILFGKGSVKKIADYIRGYGNRVLVVSDDHLKELKAYRDVIENLTQNKFEFYSLKGVHSNPRLDVIYEGIELCRKRQIDFIIAVGGGSVIDTAKTIAFGSKTNIDVWEYFLREQTENPYEIKEAVALGTVSTMAASGSETNGTAVVTNSKTKEKLYVYNRDVLKPKFAVMDPEYTYSIPADYTAYGAFDIFCHLFEQYCTPTKDAPLQARFGESVMKTVFDNAEIVLKQPDNYEARANLMWCASVTLLGIVDPGVTADSSGHGIEHELSAWYDIAHGAGLGIIFPNWMEYVAKKKPYKFVAYAKNVWNINDAGKSEMDIALEGVEKTREFVRKLKMPVSFREVGIDDSCFEKMADAAVRFHPQGSYYILNKEEIIEILKMCL